MVGFFEHRIARLQEKDARQKAFVNDPENDYFRVACSCPPDKRIHMRGGLMWQYPSGFSATDGNGWFVDPLICDFADADQVGREFTFTNANYYLAYAVTLEDGDINEAHTFVLSGSGTEFASAGDAENDLIQHAYDTAGVWESNYPLCGVILRNDGTLGTGANILPIDTINRGRSYTWPRDLRPRNIAL